MNHFRPANSVTFEIFYNVPDTLYAEVVRVAHRLGIDRLGPYSLNQRIVIQLCNNGISIVTSR